jgi:hypothetical protein
MSRVLVRSTSLVTSGSAGILPEHFGVMGELSATIASIK